MDISTEKNLHSISETHHIWFMHKKNVIGVGVGNKIINGVNTGEPCLHVLVKEKVSLNKLNLTDIIPKTYLGVKTDVIETGEFKPLTSLVTRVRPLKFGYSISPVSTPYAGTAGCLVYNDDGKYILSNNHVLADENRIEVGRAITQPAGAESMNPENNIIAILDKIMLLNFSNSIEEPSYNYADCAIAKLLPDVYYTAYIESIGYPRGISDIKIGDSVQKSGRTSGYTQGTITTIHSVISLNYDAGLAVFKDQILSTPMAQPGDSGSLVLNNNNYAVGLLFASGPNGTIFSPISNILNYLNVKMVTS